jgi:hypothetical protein
MNNYRGNKKLLQNIISPEAEQRLLLKVFVPTLF